MLLSFNVLLSSIEERFPVTLFCVDISRDELLLQLNELISRDGVHGVMEGKDSQIVDMFLPFICVLCTGLQNIQMMGI